MARIDPESQGDAPQPRHDSPARLVFLARVGDRDGFRKLYRHFAPMVHAVALGVLNNHDADDVTQEVFLEAWKKLGDLRDPDRCGAWLCTMARNRARKLAVKRARSTERHVVDPAELDTRVSSDGHPTRGLGAERLLALLREIPEAFREVLTLRLVEKYSGPQIAAQLGRPEGSVRVNLHRGMELLRARLRRESEQA